MIKAPIALGVYLSGVMTNSSMSSSRKSSITTPPTANNPGMLIVVWDHRNDIKCSHSLSEVPRRGPWRTPEEQVHPIVPSSYSVKVYRLPVVSAGTCTCLIIFREPIIDSLVKVCVGRIRTNVPTPGYNIQSLFRTLPQHTVARRCAKSLELPQNGFYEGIIISQSPLHLVDNCQSDRRAPAPPADRTRASIGDRSGLIRLQRRRRD